MTAYLAILTRRYQRLCRYLVYGQNGRGDALTDQEYAMVCLCIYATAADIARLEVEG